MSVTCSQYNLDNFQKAISETNLKKASGVSQNCLVLPLHCLVLPAFGFDLIASQVK